MNPPLVVAMAVGVNQTGAGEQCLIAE